MDLKLSILIPMYNASKSIIVHGYFYQTIIW